MVTCSVIAALVICSPVDFDLASVTPSPEEMAERPLPQFVLKAAKEKEAPWSLESTRSHHEQTYVRPPQFAPGLSFKLARMMWRVRYDKDGAYVDR
jgi:hypothetical protein